MSQTSTITASDICDALSRKAIADRIGVRLTAVSNASVEGTFPSAWFSAIEGMCAEKGIECPRHLFRWKATPARAPEAAA